MIKVPPFGGFQSTNPTMSIVETVKRDFQIVGKSGLTMLKCSRLINQFSDFIGKVTISNGAISVDGRSLIGMLRLAAVAGTILTVELVGPHADQAMHRIAPLMANVS